MRLRLIAEYEELVPPFSPAAEKASMREIFGATEEDVDRLRIVSLQEVCPTLCQLLWCFLNKSFG